MILFQDFDGVLHPAVCEPDQLFVKVPLLAQWLTRWPEIQIVISSGWRAECSQSELVALLGSTIGPRVVGQTPFHGTVADELKHPYVSALGFQREDEILGWMSMSWDPTRAWIALDDFAPVLRPRCAQLVLCDPATLLSVESLRELDRHAELAGLRPCHLAGGSE